MSINWRAVSCTGRQIASTAHNSVCLPAFARAFAPQKFSNFAMMCGTRLVDVVVAFVVAVYQIVASALCSRALRF